MHACDTHRIDHRQVQVRHGHTWLTVGFIDEVDAEMVFGILTRWREQIVAEAELGAAVDAASVLRCAPRPVRTVRVPL